MNSPPSVDENSARRVLIVVPPLVGADEEQFDPGSDRPDFEARRLVSPVEPLTVAAVLSERGFDVRIFDMGVHPESRYEKFEADYREFEPDYLAVVQAIITFATAQDWDGDKVFRISREISPGIRTVLTGNNATNYPGVAVEKNVCDYSIKGEVDFALPDLFSRLASGKIYNDIDGLSYKAHDGTLVNNPKYPAVDVSKLPVPAYELLDEMHIQQYARILERGKIRYPEKNHNYRDIMTSRSCILRCSFCSVAHLRGPRQRYRKKPLALLIDEITAALDSGIGEVHFFDDLFAQSTDEIIKFCDQVVKRGMKFNWFVAQGMPLWVLTEEALTAMRDAGMYRLIAPFESGNQRVLREVVGKIKSTIDHHHNAANWASKLGIELIGMFVVGMAGEERSEILDTVTFAEQHPEIDYSVFSIATPMVGTRLFDKVKGQLEDEGVINRVIKRTVALYESDEFAQYELGVIRAFDWDRINFSTEERRIKYARMVGISLDELDQMREHSRATFYKFFPDYQGPLSFRELFDQTETRFAGEPVIPETLY